MVQNKGILLNAFDINCTFGLAVLFIDFMIHLISMIYICTMPGELFDDYFPMYFIIRTVTSNFGFAIELTSLLISFIIMLVFMYRIFKVYNARESKEIKIRLLICGSGIILAIVVRLVFTVGHLIEFIPKTLDLPNEVVQFNYLVQWQDIPFVVFVKFLPSFFVIVMMNKPTLCW